MTTSPEAAGNTVHDQRSRIDNAFASGAASAPGPAGHVGQAPPPDTHGAYGALLTRIGRIMGWTWDERQIAEALPYAQEIGTLSGFRAVAHRLGADTLVRRFRLRDINPRSLPCLIETAGGPLLLTGFGADGAPVVETPDGKPAGAAIDPSRRHPVCFLARRRAEDRDGQSVWMKSQFRFLRRPIVVLAGVSLLINMIALGTPLFTMAVYDFAVRGGSLATLTLLFVGAVLALVAELRLRRERTELIAEAGSRFDAALSSAIFQRLLDLPLRMTESAAISQQVLRFRQLESIRAIFTGHIVNALLDLPFLLVMIVLVFLIAGPVGFVPLALAGLYVLIMTISHPVQSALATRDARVRADLHEAQRETISKLPVIQQLGIQKGWSARLAQLSAEASEARFRMQLAENTLHAATHAMVMVAGVSVLGIGAGQVLAGTMSTGALVATMMLIWRVLTPLQVVCISSIRIAQFLAAIGQVNQIMALPAEKRAASSTLLRRKLKGALRMEGVSYRHSRESEPALRGVSINIAAGQAVAICGPAASGKSTLLKCLAGIYEPATGGVYADGLNLRQMRIADYRTVIGYLPPRARLFHGSVLQNLRLIAPGATEAELREALDRAGVEVSASQLANGLATFAKGFGGAELDEGLQLKIFLAGLYARRPPILLLDDPGAFLDEAGDARLREQILQLKGAVTIVIVTNRPSHLKLCDRVIGMQGGVIALDGPADKAVAALSAAEAKRRNPIPNAA
jgi:ATP-binding cassette, subfamily C, bacterial LapB